MSNYLIQLVTEKRLKQIVLFFWLFLGLITGLICLTASFSVGFEVFINASAYNVFLFVLFCSSLLKMMLVFQNGLAEKPILWALIVAEVVSLNPLTAIALLIVARQKREAEELTLQGGLALILLGLLGILQLLLYFAM